MSNLIQENNPKPFLRNHNGILLELLPDPPLEKKIKRDEVCNIEQVRGYKIQLLKHNNKFYIYRLR